MVQLVHRDELENPHPVAWRKISFTDRDVQEFAINRGRKKYSIVEEGEYFVFYVESGEAGYMKDLQVKKIGIWISLCVMALLSEAWYFVCNLFDFKKHLRVLNR